MRNSSEKKLQRVVAYFCATLFALFSFVFVAFYQAPLLEILYDHVATGKLEYNSIIVATIITVVLTLMALWLNRFAKFQREWTAMAYLPSSLILAFITDIDRTIYTGSASYMGWIVIFAICLVVYVFFSFVLNRMLFEKIKNLAASTNRIIWRNLILLVILFLVSGTLSNGDGNIKREALAANYLKDGDTGKALEVGYYSLDASKQLTVLRSFAMAKDGLLGERLFEYPQLYGADGLLPALEQDSPLVPDSVFTMLGTTPSEREDALTFLERAACVDSASHVAIEYYLSALLLEKRLPEFKDALERLLDGPESVDLPKHYREALYLYASIEQCPLMDNGLESLSASFDSLKSIEERYDDVIVRGNYVRKDFGRTYWWYFLYGIH